MIETLAPTVKDQVAAAIRRDLIAGRLGEGQPLREQALAARFGVSRGPIRDALLELTKEGLLVAKPNCGVRTNRAPSPAVRRMLVEMRRRIERTALGLGFARIDRDRIAGWAAQLDQFEQACRASAMHRVVDLDLAFHRSIVELPGQGLEHVWLPVMGRMVLPYSRHARLLESFREHRAVLDAIERGDRKEAVRCLMANIQ
jgi:GntR family transcriptional regulator, rspAB operon transcriptional repressor